MFFVILDKSNSTSRKGCCVGNVFGGQCCRCSAQYNCNADDDDDDDDQDDDYDDDYVCGCCNEYANGCCRNVSCDDDDDDDCHIYCCC